MGSETSVKVVIADDHAIVRKATISILEEIDQVEIADQVADGLAAIASIRKHQPGLVILDSAMPHAKGIEVLAETKRWSPNSRIIVLTGFTSAGILSDWLAAGAEGILLKSCEPEEMKRCFETVLAGGKFIAASAKKILDTASSVTQLTLREREVLSQIAMGHQNSGIAERLSISVRTVEKHRASLMDKVGVTSAAQLITYALKEGLLEQDTQL